MFTATFTDPQGVEHVDAVFQVADANYHSNETLNFNFRLSTAAGEETKSGGNSMSYRMFYWVNQAAVDAGKLPYILANATPDQLGETFYVNDLDPAYDGLTLEQKAEKHCQEVVLANM
jgi:hypothetical protein